VCGAVGQVPGTLIDWAAGVIGIPCTVVAAQITEESGGNPDALSPTGAQGVAQFEPGTWAGEGCAGSPNNVNNAMTCYAKMMYQLVKQYGSVRDALAAYNAGGANIAAGYGYADTILGNAGQSQGLTGGGGTGAPGGAPGATTTAATSDSTCLIGGSGFFNLVDVCLFSKTEARALTGGLALAGGGFLALLGLLFLAVYGLRETGAGKAAGGAMEGIGAGLLFVPGAEGAGLALGAAGAGARHSSSQAIAARRSARAGRAADDAELAGKGASNIKTANRRQPPPTKPGRRIDSKPASYADDKPPF
jgi:hypothetical protein